MTLAKYIIRRYCPHDIVKEDFALAFTEAHCDYLHGEYNNPCAICWDKFITEVLRDLDEAENERV